jgi:hypothetical protein
MFVDCTNKMAAVSELHVAIQKCQYALVKKLVADLRNQNVDVSNELAFAKQLAQVKGGAYKKVVEAF